VKISECIKRLESVKAKHGDIECESDCPYCGRSFHVGIVAVAPETVRLNGREIDGPVGTRKVSGGAAKESA
jgi:hypothetical protein